VSAPGGARDPDAPDAVDPDLPVPVEGEVVDDDEELEARVEADLDAFDKKAARAKVLEEIAEEMSVIAADEAEELFVDGTPGRSDLAAERDEYLDALRRVKAEFDNYKKRTEKERLQMVDRASEVLVNDLLPVLEACDAAVAHGDEGVIAIRALLFEVLGKGGLEKMEPEGKPFDPTMHEAVLREEGEGPSDTVVEVLRPGYTWRGRVLRPAMVKVRT
jgi:molecular chaperone GrpE